MLLTLAIGIGANTAVFSVVNSVIPKPLPFPESSRLVSLWLNAPGAAGLASFQKSLPLSPSMYFTFHPFELIRAHIRSEYSRYGPLDGVDS